MLKPGLKTTEFYMPIIVALLGFLVSMGLLSTELSQELVTAIAAAVPAAAGLIGAVWTAVIYIKGRVELKK